MLDYMNKVGEQIPQKGCGMSEENHKIFIECLKNPKSPPLSLETELFLKRLDEFEEYSRNVKLIVKSYS